MTDDKPQGASLLIAAVADELEEAALAIAREEGARGVTILPSRGIGFPEHITFFGVTYRGIGVVMLWVLDGERATRIAARMNRELELLRPFQGLAFVAPVDATGGIDPAAIRKYLGDGPGPSE
ncbi:hypothetical protein [Aquisalimonas asiatica]|uniref:Nitrogen regulatory protein P-II family n=1 Tax=Aquisalimonas asiatica TaxID=406100 RepID=A0A1H8SKT2_9GAMM|nr:hypothetical protein [Aquisalimonas asiatica]SEO79292.1 hypothetical protein SAMN04488052_10339 [Aquisalimonas asiatica]